MRAAPSARLAVAWRALWRRAARMPRGARLALVGVAVVAGFAVVVLPLFQSSGAPRAEIGGLIPDTARATQPLRVDIAVDNTGDGPIYPLCLLLHGSGATLVSADFQGLDNVRASGNRVCGGQLSGQETISVTVVLTLEHAGSTQLTLLPQQGATVIGPALTGTVSVS